MAQTKAVLASTGSVAGVTAKGVASLADSIAAKTGVDDEAIASAQNLLLTFTSVKNGVGASNKVFDSATQTIVDMNASLGRGPSGLTGTTTMVGKALQDPIKGISALSRVGVNFTKQQKAQIKTLVASGDTMGAQKLILKELNKEFGGSAAAQGTAWDKLKVQLGNLQESLGQKLIPMLDKLAAWLSKNLPKAIDYLSPKFTAFGKFLSTRVAPVLKSVAEFVGKNSAAFKVLAGVVLTIAAAVRTYIAVQTALNFVMSANPVGLVIIAIAGLVAGIVIAYKKSETFRTVVKAVTTAILGYFRLMANVWLTIVSVILSGISKLLTPLAALPGKFGAPFRAAKRAVDAANGSIKTLRDRINGIPKPRSIRFSLPGASAAIQKLADLRWQISHIPRSVTIGVNNKLANIPQYATGTNYHPGGYAIVGEQGPELVSLPTGSKVFTNKQSGQMAGGGTVTQNFTFHISGNDPSAIVDAIKRYVKLNGPIRGVAA